MQRTTTPLPSQIDREDDEDEDEGIQKVALKSLKIAYVVVCLAGIASLAYDLATAKSYGIRNSIKLECFQENFKVTLLERPSEK